MKLKIGINFIFLFCFASHLYAGTLLIVTDDTPSAQVVHDLIMRLEPFKSMVNFKIITQTVLTHNLAACTTSPILERSLNCETLYAKYGASVNADRVLIIKKDQKCMGAGDLNGLGAAMTTACSPLYAIHELCHTAGLMDEYQYVTAIEANTFCSEKNSAPNIAFFKDFPPYASDEAARAMHASQIPWYNKITAEKITYETDLGTPEPNQLGLYPSDTCGKATNEIKSWRPGDSKVSTIMREAVAEIPESYYPSIIQAFNTPEKKAAKKKTRSVGTPISEAIK